MILLLANLTLGQSPTPPNLSREWGSRLPALARQAMLHYLEHRGDANDIPIPTAVKDSYTNIDGKHVLFCDMEYPVILTLRDKGQPVARSVHHGAGVANNVIFAALKAMRCRSLPNRISKAYLESLTIELEIVGPFVPVEEERIEEELKPGLEGLKLAVGIEDPKLQGPSFQDVYQEAIVSPATAYVLGWDASRMKEQCLAEIRWRPENQSLRRQWSRFATLHYIEYPNTTAKNAPKGTWLLYRGKIRTPPFAFDDLQARLNAARLVGDFLLRNQERSGQYTLPSPNPKTSIAQQLHAAWAMMQLGTAAKSTAYTNSAKALLGFVAKQYVKLSPDDTLASVFTPDPKQEVLATAFFALAAGADFDQNDQNPASQDIVKKLLAFLRSRMDEDGHFLDAKGQPVDDVSAAVALLAMQTLAPDPADKSWQNGVDAMLYDAGLLGGVEKKRALSATAHAWLGLALLTGKRDGDLQYQKYIPGFATYYFQSPNQNDVPSDETDDLFTSAGQAETQPNALGVILLYQAIQKVQILQVSNHMNYRASIAMQKRLSFCWQMLYRMEEAYFTSTPAQWAGAARRSAQAAEVSLAACAAIIEAFLLK